MLSRLARATVKSSRVATATEIPGVQRLFGRCVQTATEVTKDGTVDWMEMVSPLRIPD